MNLNEPSTLVLFGREDSAALHSSRPFFGRRCAQRTAQHTCQGCYPPRGTARERTGGDSMDRVPKPMGFDGECIGTGRRPEISWNKYTPPVSCDWCLHPPAELTELAERRHLKALFPFLGAQVTLVVKAKKMKRIVTSKPLHTHGHIPESKKSHSYQQA